MDMLRSMFHVATQPAIVQSVISRTSSANDTDPDNALPPDTEEPLTPDQYVPDNPLPADTEEPLTPNEAVPEQPMEEQPTVQIDVNDLNLLVETYARECAVKNMPCKKSRVAKTCTRGTTPPSVPAE